MMSSSDYVPTVTAADCPICCEPLNESDKLYPLHCPTPTCNYNYCAQCIAGMQASAAEEYQEASDGSRQLKVHVQCPQCRAKYVAPTLDDKKSNIKAPSSNVVVNAVLLCRRAHEILPRIAQIDSELNAKQLATKYQFLNDVSVQDVKDALATTQSYHTMIKQKPVPDMDLQVLHNVLDRLSRRHLENLDTNGHVIDPKDSSSIISLQQRRQQPRADPSLFLGLEESMTRDEQEFVTSMLLSGKVDCVAQAALILQGILLMTAQGKAVQAVQQLSSFGIGGSSSGKNAVIDTHAMRKRFPLPSRMPRCVSLPVYDPTSRKVYLKFAKPTVDKASGEEEGSSLVIASVHGPAGRLGIRKGDIVTHLQGEPVPNLEEYTKLILSAYNEGDAESTVTLVVNADEETCKALQERADKMKTQQVFV